MIDKPKIYQNRITKEINNNLKVYNGFNTNNKVNNKDIRNKIRMIINSNNFIYSKLVNIKVRDNIIKRKIIGIMGNNLVTIDNEYIPIDNISDIYI